MLSEAATPGTVAAPATGSLPPRAAIALLTLQLRAATQEAESAEAEETGADHEAARDQLRARLEPLMAERRQALDAALVQARSEASDSVARAHRAASEIIVAASAPIVAASAPLVVPAAAQTPVAAVEEMLAPVVEAEVPAPVEPIVAPLEEIKLPAGTIMVPASAFPPPPSPPPPLASPIAATVAQATVNLVIDAEAFANVFATVFATLLDERLNAWNAGLPAARPMYAPVPMHAIAPAPAKQSFWSHARHPDVLLMGAAMVIVLVVLAAWLA